MRTRSLVNPQEHPTCVLDARSAIFPLAHSACWNAGCVLTNVVSPTARPTLLTLASSRNEPGKNGATNSHVKNAEYTKEDPNLKRFRSESKASPYWVATLILTTREMPSLSIQLMAALAASARCAPTPTAVSSDWVAKFRTTALQKRWRGGKGAGRGWNYDLGGFFQRRVFSDWRRSWGRSRVQGFRRFVFVEIATVDRRVPCADANGGEQRLSGKVEGDGAAEALMARRGWAPPTGMRAQGGSVFGV